MKLSELSDVQIERIYRKAYNRCRQVYAAGSMYGLDFNTISVSWTNTLRTLRKEFTKRF